jgi:bacteriocin-like protein
MPSKRKSAKKALVDTLAETNKKGEGELTEDELKSVIGGAAAGGTPANTPAKINFPEGNPSQPIIIGSVYNG